MVRRKRVFGLAVTRALLAVLLVTQSIVMADACAFAMPDCVRYCPSGPCNGSGPNLCNATHARTDQAPNSDGIAIVSHPAAAVGALDERANLYRPHAFARWLSPSAARPPAHIFLCRMLN